MTTQRDVWVFVEQNEGQLADVSLELLSKGRELAGQLQGQVVAILCGSQVRSLADTAIHYGADRVLLADDAELAAYRTMPYARIISGLVKARQPYIFLIGATSQGRDLAPRVASMLKVGLTADCTDLQIGPHTDAVAGKEYPRLLYQIRPAFGGNNIATIVNPETRPQMATVREGVMRMGAAQPGRTGRLVRFDGAIDEALQVVAFIEQHRAERKVDLKKASIVVAGGAGVGGPEGFDKIRHLAEVLGGEVGASRAAVDGGYIDKAHQVGQTGTTVRPKLYIACGISGAVQHRAGMQESSKIVAINTDPDAPIFDIAHYGIVGDLNQVVPMLIKAYKGA